MWDSTKNFIAIIVPENYLNLYNFGFAESQGLPVLSKNTISNIEFNIQISGNGLKQNYKSKIVGFSNKINSILVPENFLSFANERFGSTDSQRQSRVLIEFENASDESILQFFNDHNYAIKKDKLEFSKLIFFFKSGILFMFVIAVIIVAQSCSSIILSINLIIQKNKTLILNLYSIGFAYKEISRFYQITISAFTFVAISIAILMSVVIRNLYIAKFDTLFDFRAGDNMIIVYGLCIVVTLLISYNFLLLRNIRRLVKPVRSK